MAKFNSIDCDIWEEMLFYKPSQKLLYIYLFSNPLCRPSGLYRVHPDTIYHYTRTNQADLEAITGKLIEYDFGTGEVWVRGKMKRILSGFLNNEKMRLSVKSDFDALRSVFIKSLFYNKYEGALGGLVSPPLPIPIPIPIPLPLALKEDERILRKEGENPEKQAIELPSLSLREKWFDELWQNYPNKDGKKHAKRHFLASVKTGGDLTRCKKALENYLGSERVKNGYVKNGSTFFNDWESWEFFKDERRETDAERDARLIAKYAK